MKFTAALSFVLLRFLMDLTEPVNTVLIRRDSCTSRSQTEYTCPNNFNTIKINYYTTCFRVIWESQNKTAMEAARICERLKLNILDLKSTKELEWTEIVFQFSVNFSRIWVMPILDDKRYDINADTVCPVLKIGHFTEIPCGEKASVACEREADPVNTAKQKPVVSVNGRGDPSKLILYEGTRVTLGCSVIRVRRAWLELHVEDTNGKIWMFNRNNMTIYEEQLWCGVITIAYTEQALGLRVKTVTCLVDWVNKKDCSLSRNAKSCASEGPFAYHPGEVGLQLFVQFHGRPNIVLNQKELFAFCFSDKYDYEHFRFAFDVDNKIEIRDSNIEFRPEGHADYTDGKPAAVLKLDLSDECLGGKQFDLLCYDQERIVGPIKKCERDSLLCSRIRVIVDNKPLLEVKGKQFRQDTQLYENSNVTITCSYIRPPEFQPAIHLSDSPVYSRSFTGEDLDVNIEKVKCGVRTSATLEIFLSRSMDLMKKFVTCAIGSDDFTLCDEKNTSCVQRGPFEYLSAPKKVELKVNNVSESPNIVAKCTSFGFKTVWTMTDLSDNKTLNVLSKHDQGVKIEEMEIPEKKAWISHLTVQTMSKGLAGETLTLGCYTEKIYADQLGCLESYFWCNTVVLKIGNQTTDDEDDITFMKMSMIVLASVLPLVLIFVCCVMCKLCPCRKKKQAMPVAGVPSTVQAGTDSLEKNPSFIEMKQKQ